MISDLQTIQTYEHPRFRGVRNSEVLLYSDPYNVKPLLVAVGSYLKLKLVC